MMSARKTEEGVLRSAESCLFRSSYTLLFKGFWILIVSFFGEDARELGSHWAGVIDSSGQDLETARILGRVLGVNVLQTKNSSRI